MVTPDGRKKAQLCHIHMLQPYVERGDNLDEDPAQFNVLFFWDLVSENILFPRKFSSELNSSHLHCAAELGL